MRGAPNLTEAQVWRICRAYVFLSCAADHITDFERDTVADAGARWMEQGRSAVITAGEWAVIGDVLDVIEHDLAKTLSSGAAT